MPPRPDPEPLRLKDLSDDLTDKTSKPKGLTELPRNKASLTRPGLNPTLTSEPGPTSGTRRLDLQARTRLDGPGLTNRLRTLLTRPRGTRPGQGTSRDQTRPYPAQPLDPKTSQAKPVQPPALPIPSYLTHSTQPVPTLQTSPNPVR